MDVDTLRAVLGWASLLNMGLLLFWFAMFMIAHDWIQSVHSRWFNIPTERIDAIHYASMGFYELTIFVVLLGPYLALRIVGAPSIAKTKALSARIATRHNI